MPSSGSLNHLEDFLTKTRIENHHPFPCWFLSFYQKHFPPPFPRGLFFSSPAAGLEPSPQRSESWHVGAALLGERGLGGAIESRRRQTVGIDELQKNKAERKGWGWFQAR